MESAGKPLPPEVEAASSKAADLIIGSSLLSRLLLIFFYSTFEGVIKDVEKHSCDVGSNLLCHFGNSQMVTMAPDRLVQGLTSDFWFAMICWWVVPVVKGDCGVLCSLQGFPRCWNPSFQLFPLPWSCSKTCPIRRYGMHGGLTSPLVDVRTADQKIVDYK